MNMIDQLKKDLNFVSNKILLSVNINPDGEIFYIYKYKEAEGVFELCISQFSHDRSDTYKIISTFETEFKKRLGDDLH